MAVQLQLGLLVFLLVANTKAINTVRSQLSIVSTRDQPKMVARVVEACQNAYDISQFLEDLFQNMASLV
jgi:hypothetical protein